LTQVGIKLAIFLPQHLGCWDYTWLRRHLARKTPFASNILLVKFKISREISIDPKSNDFGE
jgi:hypothetical protein